MTKEQQEKSLKRLELVLSEDSMGKGKDSFYAKYIKRILDFTLSLIALIVLSPLLLILTVTGAIAMKGNPFFVQKRPGKIDPKTGKECIFSLIKFRTMDNRRDAEGNLLPDAVRLNKYGKFLRKTSLDELPSLVNIIKSDLSIVGPRPLLIEYLPYYTAEERTRHTVKPGLTGLAQISGRNNLGWERRFELDIFYANELCFALDVKVLAKTLKKVLMHDDVISDGKFNLKDLNVERKNNDYQKAVSK